MEPKVTQEQAEAVIGRLRVYGDSIAADLIEALAAERDTALRDAERYRWLRAHLPGVDSGVRGAMGWLSQEGELDIFVDAYLSSSPHSAEKDGLLSSESRETK